ncbi:putative cop9 signalosome complex subunit 5 [Phaeomoniella chlamydospora]|uniref:COP9 signalosome complex subunit 5 n=1 Tax=Phaeomoniella chlamydospora TaxID=158046 RepID=A0A0G2HJM1_PHACM|nr:putative cop9 signalosome complex subunit 5 [Phaeomoniella chlamydospora]
MSQLAAALRAWEAENSVLAVDPSQNALYNLSPAAQKSLQEARPWKKDPKYFTSIRISALALLKMTMHARSGGNIEVMGLMQGYVTSNTFIVTDAFRLPVEGTETRVNAQDDANEYMVNYLQASREGGGRPENAVGWYHSHPGYGCWLSGIDVATQFNQQMFQDPFVAVVIDPDRTVSAGKVEIGAFRTYPKDYKPPSSAPGYGTDEDGYQSIPMGKVEDFGAHASQYYSLEVSHFKSTLDSQLLSLLWNKYWTATLSQSPLITNRDYTTKQIADLAEKTKTANRSLKSGRRAEIAPSRGPESKGSIIKVAKDPQLDQVVRNAGKIEREEMNGLMAEEVKQKLFWGVVQEAISAESSNGTEEGEEAMTT